MILPEFCEELFYVKKVNLFETRFKNYLEKVNNYNILKTQKWLKGLNKNYTIKELKELRTLYVSDKEDIINAYFDPTTLYININRPKINMIYLKSLKSLKFNCAIVNIEGKITRHKLNWK